MTAASTAARVRVLLIPNAQMSYGETTLGAIIEGCERIGIHITHVYGLTETYGPATVNEWKPVWDDLDKAERGAKTLEQAFISIINDYEKK